MENTRHQQLIDQSVYIDISNEYITGLMNEYRETAQLLSSTEDIVLTEAITTVLKDIEDRYKSSIGIRILYSLNKSENELFH